MVGPVSKSTSTILGTSSSNQRSSNNGEEVVHSQSVQPIALAASKGDDINSNEKWFGRIRRRLSLRNNRRRLDIVDDDEDDDEDIVNSVVTSVISNNRRRLDSTNDIEDKEENLNREENENEE